MDLDFGPDGALYVIEWGSGFNGNNADSGVYRVDYLKGGQKPRSRRRPATPTEGLAPLTVNFSSAGSSDPKGTTLTYAWDFGDGGTIDRGQPLAHLRGDGAYTGQAHRHRRRGLTGGRQHGRDRRQPHAVVTIEFPRTARSPPSRTSRLQDLGHRPRGRVTGSGIKCNDVRVDGLARPRRARARALADHGLHRHLSTGLTSGHGAEANTFTVLGVVLHRPGRSRRRPGADRSRAGDPAAQDQAGGVLLLHRPRRRRRHQR